MGGKEMSRCKKALMVILTICLTLLFAVPVLADESDSVNAARNGVLQVNLVYVDKNGTAYPLQGGSGFLISDQVLLTNQHVVQMSEKTKQDASEAYGVDFVNDNKLDIRLQVVVQRDVVIDATVKKSSAEMDVAIVDLSEPIYVEDDDNIRDLIKIALEGFGYQVKAFETAEDALQKIGADKPDLGVFDLMLPGMDGLAAIRIIRRNPDIREMPIIVLTAKDKELDKVIP